MHSYCICEGDVNWQPFSGIASLEGVCVCARDKLEMLFTARV